MARTPRKDPPVRAVFFDIGNVLLKFDAKDVAREVTRMVGRHPIRVARYLWHSDLGHRVERGEVSPRRLYRVFRSELGYDGNYEAFKKLWCDHFTLIPETAALVKRLSRRYKVYLLSNTNHMHYEFIRRNFRFPRHAHGAVLSYKLGLRKPGRGIYLAALKKARVRPQEAVFIDDLEENVEAARRLGFKALRYTGYEGLKRDLAALGILRGPAFRPAPP